MNAPRPRKLLRRLAAGSLGALVAGVLLAALVAGWLAGTNAGARFALGRVAALTGAKVGAVEGVLVGPLALGSLEIVTDRLTVRASRVALDWRPLALLANEVHVTRLHAEALEVESAPSGGPASPPATLAAPFAVHLAQASVDRLRVGTRGEDGSALAFGEITAKLAGNRLGWAVGALEGVTPAGRAKLSGTVGAQAPFDIAATGELAGTRGGAGYRVAIEAKGPLAKLDVRFDGAQGEFAARGHATVEPFAAVPLARLVAKVTGLDLAAFVPSPRTRLAVEADLAPRGGALLAGAVRIENAIPGPLDKGLVPVATLSGEISAHAGRLEATGLSATFAPGGKARGRLAWSGGRLTAKLAVSDGDLLSWHTTLRPTKLAGDIAADVDGEAQSFTVALADPRFSIAGLARIAGGRVALEGVKLSRGAAMAEASGAFSFVGDKAFALEGRLEKFDPAAFAKVPAGELNAQWKVSGRLAGAPSGEALVQVAKSRLGGLDLQGTLDVAGDGERLARAVTDLALGATRLRTSGAFGRAGDTLEVKAVSPDLAPLGRAFGLAMGGRLDLDARLAGTFAAPSGEATFSGAGLVLPGGLRIEDGKGRLALGAGDEGAANGELALRGVRRGGDGPVLAQEARLALAGTRASHTLRLEARQDAELSLRAMLDGGFAPGAAAPAWQGRLESLSVTGRDPLTLAAPATLRLSAGAVELGPAVLGGQSGTLRLAKTRWSPEGLEASGASEGVVMRAILRALDLQQQAGSNLVLAGEWDGRVGEAFEGHALLRRVSGDLRVGEPRQALGLEAAQVRIDATGGQLRATLEVRGTRVGRWQGEGRATLRRGEHGWEVSPVAPLEGRFTVDVPDLSWTAAWLGPEARVAGRLAGSATVAGTARDPEWRGRLEATGLALREPTLGAEVDEGTVVVTLAERFARIERFELAAAWRPEADAAKALVHAKRPGKGFLRAEGAIDLATRKGAIAAKADRYPVTRLPTRFLAVTGEGRIEIDGSRTAITGDLKADAGWFGIPAAAPPSLSDDVIVERGRPVEAAPVTERIRLDLRVDLGEQLYFEGRGLSTRLAGSLRHTGDIGPALRTTGTIRAVGGTLDAYGRKLTLERGALNFQGPIDNPGLNVLALRKGLAVEAGVEVTGTVSRPRARLVSSPDVPEAEKLAWLVLGRGRGEISAADAATLVGAANALVGGDVLPAGRLLRGLGLDELNFGSEEGGALGTLPQSTVAGRTGSASAAEVVSVGKQLTENIHVSYRQGLADAEGSLRVALQFSKSLQFILRAGSDPGVDAVYRFTFE